MASNEKYENETTSIWYDHPQLHVVLHLVEKCHCICSTHLWQWNNQRSRFTRSRWGSALLNSMHFPLGHLLDTLKWLASNGGEIWFQTSASMEVVFWVMAMAFAPKKGLDLFELFIYFLMVNIWENHRKWWSTTSEAEIPVDSSHGVSPRKWMEVDNTPKVLVNFRMYYRVCMGLSENEVPKKNRVYCHFLRIYPTCFRQTRDRPIWGFLEFGIPKTMGFNTNMF